MQGKYLEFTQLAIRLLKYLKEIVLKRAKQNLFVIETHSENYKLYI